MPELHSQPSSARGLGRDGPALLVLIWTVTWPSMSHSKIVELLAEPPAVQRLSWWMATAITLPGWHSCPSRHPSYTPATGARKSASSGKTMTGLLQGDDWLLVSWLPHTRLCKTGLQPTVTPRPSSGLAESRYQIIMGAGCQPCPVQISWRRV